MAQVQGLRRYSWLFVFLVAVGGLWYPKLGLLIVPIMLALPILGFKGGKYWCGNFCPHGSLFDFLLARVSQKSPIPVWARATPVKALVFIVFLSVRTINARLGQFHVLGERYFPRQAGPGIRIQLPCRDSCRFSLGIVCASPHLVPFLSDGHIPNDILPARFGCRAE
ncbi:MAG TPA: 4Fe-4S binding protein [Firmicutes bacterium]|jgi:hypothetical protein|nr:4Fe-4S binding protein [Bacillota bacterium]